MRRAVSVEDRAPPKDSGWGHAWQQWRLVWRKHNAPLMLKIGWIAAAYLLFKAFFEKERSLREGRGRRARRREGHAEPGGACCACSQCQAAHV